MAFWVYENWQGSESKARIHVGSCPYCNYGQGTNKTKGTDNGKWHGGLLGYPDFDKAETTAQQTGRPVSCCGHCKPNRGDSATP